MNAAGVPRARRPKSADGNVDAEPQQRPRIFETQPRRLRSLELLRRRRFAAVERVRDACQRSAIFVQRQSVLLSGDIAQLRRGYSLNHGPRLPVELPCMKESTFRAKRTTLRTANGTLV